MQQNKCKRHPGNRGDDSYSLKGTGYNINIKPPELFVGGNGFFIRFYEPTEHILWHWRHEGETLWSPAVDFPGKQLGIGISDVTIEVSFNTSGYHEGRTETKFYIPPLTEHFIEEAQ